jgi:hypothetical protein
MDDVVYIRGAAAISKELQKLGLIAADHPDPESATYNLIRTKQIDVDRFGRSLITTKLRLRQLVAKRIA